ncbi:hypothetical protein [Sphingomonas profundi]|uniref:hypothetical protein n=1 Tax=Alterirhizorhabdus profundi TaxID=2681549 RepID=UPI0012E884DF|nr:hypothetical protein [Sphingomonas profundi]
MADIRPLSLEQIDPALRATLQPTVDRLGYFGAFFQYGGHVPDVLTGFMKYSGTLKAALPDDLNETIALTVCAQLDFAYERIQHERLSLKLGFAKDWVALLVGRPSHAALTSAQRAARDLALAIAGSRPEQARDALGRLAAEQGEAQAMAALFQASRFASICMVGKVLDMQLPVPSIFADDTGA